MEIQIKAAHIITQNNLYLALTNHMRCGAGGANVNLGPVTTTADIQ